MSVDEDHRRRRSSRSWQIRLATALLTGSGVGVLVGGLSESSPEIIAGAAIGVAVATFMVQVFTWVDGNKGDGGAPPSIVA